jgi:hypothetical protein
MKPLRVLNDDDNYPDRLYVGASTGFFYRRDRYEMAFSCYIGN